MMISELNKLKLSSVNNNAVIVELPLLLLENTYLTAYQGKRQLWDVTFPN